MITLRDNGEVRMSVPPPAEWQLRDTVWLFVAIGVVLGTCYVIGFAIDEYVKKSELPTVTAAPVESPQAAPRPSETTPVSEPPARSSAPSPEAFSPGVSPVARPAAAAAGHATVEPQPSAAPRPSTLLWTGIGNTFHTRGDCPDVKGQAVMKISGTAAQALVPCAVCGK